MSQGLKAVVFGCISGVLAAFAARFIFAPAEKPREARVPPAEGQVLFADWKAGTSPLPPPFTQPAHRPASRTLLSKEARAAIIASNNELLTSSDYLDILESLAKDDPEFLFETALHAGPLTGVVAMRCCLSHIKDFNVVATKLMALQQNDQWKSRLGSLIDEVWSKPEARRNEIFLKVLGDAEPTDDSIRIKTGILLREKAGEDLNGAIALLESHPALKKHAGEVYREWGKQQPEVAAAWLQSAVAEYRSGGSTVQIEQVASGLCGTGQPAVVQQMLETIQRSPGGPEREKLLEKLTRSAIAVGPPETWIPNVRDLRPSYQKNLIALDLGIRLDQSGAAPSNWVQWFSDIGVDAPENWATAVLMARKRR